MYLFSVCNDATLPDNQGIHLTVHSSTSAYIWKYMIYIVWIHKVQSTKVEIQTQTQSTKVEIPTSGGKCSSMNGRRKNIPCPRLGLKLCLLYPEQKAP